jgi:hypothetical protein
MAAEQAAAPEEQRVRYQWGLITAIFVAGLVLIVIAWLLDSSEPFSKFLSTIAVEVGISAGLIGFLVYTEDHLRRRIATTVRDEVAKTLGAPSSDSGLPSRAQIGADFARRAAAVPNRVGSMNPQERRSAAEAAAAQEAEIVAAQREWLDETERRWEARPVHEQYQIQLDAFFAAAGIPFDPDDPVYREDGPPLGAMPFSEFETSELDPVDPFSDWWRGIHAHTTPEEYRERRHPFARSEIEARLSAVEALLDHTTFDTGLWHFHLAASACEEIAAIALDSFAVWFPDALRAGMTASGRVGYSPTGRWPLVSDGMVPDRALEVHGYIAAAVACSSAEERRVLLGVDEEPSPWLEEVSRKLVSPPSWLFRELPDQTKKLVSALTGQATTDHR